MTDGDSCDRSVEFGDRQGYTDGQKKQVGRKKAGLKED